MLSPIPTIFVLIVVAVLMHIFRDSLGGEKLAPLRLLILVVILLYVLYLVYLLLPFPR